MGQQGLSILPVDKVSIGQAEANYSFSYRLINADELTVKEREEFFAAVRLEGQKLLKSMLENADPSEDYAAKFKTKMEKAGKNADKANIQFTGCTVDYCGIWDYREGEAAATAS